MVINSDLTRSNYFKTIPAHHLSRILIHAAYPGGWGEQGLHLGVRVLALPGSVRIDSNVFEKRVPLETVEYWRHGRRTRSPLSCERNLKGSAVVAHESQSRQDLSQGNDR